MKKICMHLSGRGRQQRRDLRRRSQPARAGLLLPLPVVLLTLGLASCGSAPDTSRGPALPVAVASKVDAATLRLQGIETVAAVATFKPTAETTISITCKSGKIFKVTTNTMGGTCQLTWRDDQTISRAECSDAGHFASAGCDQGAEGGCMSTTGRGTCDEKK